METISCVTFWNNYKDHMSDAEFMKKEFAVNKLMEPLGFDIIFAVEHHFSNYSMGPDHFQFLGYMAAITQRIKLGTLGVILPWNDPLRVAERIILLDHLSDGRAVFGMARGLAKRDYVGFHQDMEESRERDESADRAYELAHNYVGKYFGSFAEHYEIFGVHLTESKSYANYSGAKAALDTIGLDAMVKAFVESNVWGTPKQILDKYEERRAVIGDFQASATFSFSGMSFDEVKSSMTTYATKVMPELRRWSKGESKRRAA